MSEGSFKVHIHMRFGSSDFAEWCHFNRRFSISSNLHRQQQQQVFIVFMPVCKYHFSHICWVTWQCDFNRNFPIFSNCRCWWRWQYLLFSCLCKYHLMKNVDVFEEKWYLHYGKNCCKPRFFSKLKKLHSPKPPA